MAESPSVSWYLRSLADADTHCGDYSIVTRSGRALCGIEFVPKELLLGSPALPGFPTGFRAGMPTVREARPVSRSARWTLSPGATIHHARSEPH